MVFFGPPQVPLGTELIYLRMVKLALRVSAKGGHGESLSKSEKVRFKRVCKWLATPV